MPRSKFAEEDGGGTLHDLLHVYEEDGGGTLHEVNVFEEASNGAMKWVFGPPSAHSLDSLQARDASLDCDTTNPDNRIDLNWGTVGPGSVVKHVEVFRDTDSGFSGATQIASITNWLNGGGTPQDGLMTYQDGGLAEGTTYYYWVRMEFVDGTHSTRIGPAQATTCVGEL